jgi:hypothetical protein
MKAMELVGPQEELSQNPLSNNVGGLFGWFPSPKFTRDWEPPLLWNHYTKNRVVGEIT